MADSENGAILPRNPSDSLLAPAAAASLSATAAVNSPSNHMGDKNPKAKRKLQTQHELHKKHKTEEMHREQQRLHELHEMKHPHEPKS